ncbi:MAG: VIT domain-containing protein [Planctomycetota bacterium]
MRLRTSVASLLSLVLLLTLAVCGGQPKGSDVGDHFLAGRGRDSDLAHKLVDGELGAPEAVIEDAEAEEGVTADGSRDLAGRGAGAMRPVGGAQGGPVTGSPGTPSTPSRGNAAYGSAPSESSETQPGPSPRAVNSGPSALPQGHDGVEMEEEKLAAGRNMTNAVRSVEEEARLLERYEMAFKRNPTLVDGLGDLPRADFQDPAAGGHGQNDGATPAKADDNKPGAGDTGAQAWKRSSQRPSFARVYVGNGNSLVLERMRVTVHVDGPRARTVVDHVFRNPHDQALEGTFEYPLPAGASPCAYAMYVSGEQARIPTFFPRAEGQPLPPMALADLPFEDGLKKVDERDWGKLREARVVRRQKARQVYEEVTRQRVDPALLEYAVGNVFRGRVFPIPPKGLNRVILVYEETLADDGGVQSYRFPLPDCDLGLLHVTVSTPIAGVADLELTPKPMTDGKVEGGRRLQQLAWEQCKGPGGDLVVRVRPEHPRALSLSGADQSRASGRAFLARLRPELPTEGKDAPTGDALFLLDASLSEAPDRFAVNRRLLQQILERDDTIRRFQVLAFDVEARWLEDGGWITNDEAGRARALAKVDTLLLEGATDLGAALRAVAEAAWIGAGDAAAPTPLAVFLMSDGQLDWGERELEPLLRPLEDRPGRVTRFFCYRNGLSAENLALFERLTRRGGATFNVFDDAAVAVAAAAVAHRRQAFVLDHIEVAGAEVQDLLVAGRQAALYPGGTLLVAGRYGDADHVRLTLHGRYGTEPMACAFDLALDGSSELAGRAWAELAVAQLLELHDPAVDDLAVAYAQQFGLATRETSFLVLETDADYERFDVATEAADCKVEDLARYLDDAHLIRARNEPSRKRAFGRLLQRLVEEAGAPDAREAPQLARLLQLLPEDELVLAPKRAAAAWPTRALAGPDYLTGLAKNRRDPALHLAEAERRAAAGEAAPALRVLSNLVELYPGRSDAQRLVGYRLLGAGEAEMAASVFEAIRDQRPFEPQSHRDLARALERAGRLAYAAIEYELVLGGKWHERFRDTVQVIVAQEYVAMMRAALREKRATGALAACFGERLEQLGDVPVRADLRVTMAWNTDDTDVDLWVHEPSGEACGYSHRETAAGGRLLDDLTRGYGPERYEIAEARPGTYTILVHYFARNPKLLAGETQVEVVVTRKAGTPEEETRRYVVNLSEEKEGVEVCRVRF